MKVMRTETEFIFLNKLTHKTLLRNTIFWTGILGSVKKHFVLFKKLKSIDLKGSRMKSFHKLHNMNVCFTLVE
jgi:hypothetical protein